MKENPTEETIEKVSTPEVETPDEDVSIWDVIREKREERLGEEEPTEKVNTNFIPNDIPGVVPTPLKNVKKKKGIEPIHMFILMIILIGAGVGVFYYLSSNYVDDGSNMAEHYTTTTLPPSE